MNIVATIQARVGSSRLPGKVLREILGKPLLALQVERLKMCRLIDRVVIATSTGSENDPLEDLANRLGIGCYRGSEEDVLGRVAEAVRWAEADVHVECLGDSPLPDPLIVDGVVGFYLKNTDRFDYVSNALTTTYPPGLETYVYPARVLRDAEERTAGQKPREHVGPFIYGNPARYRLCNLEAPPHFRAPDVYLEVDEPEDFEVVRAIYEHFYPRGPGFGLGQILDFLRERPEWAARNRHVERRWKAYRKDGDAR